MFLPEYKTRLFWWLWLAFSQPFDTSSQIALSISGTYPYPSDEKAMSGLHRVWSLCDNVMRMIA